MYLDVRRVATATRYGQVADREKTTAEVRPLKSYYECRNTVPIKSQNYDSGGARLPANTISSTISSFSVRLYVRIVSPKSEISYILNLRSKLLELRVSVSIPCHKEPTYPTLPYPEYDLQTLVMINEFAKLHEQKILTHHHQNNSKRPLSDGNSQ